MFIWQTFTQYKINSFGIIQYLILITSYLVILNFGVQTKLLKHFKSDLFSFVFTHDKLINITYALNFGIKQLSVILNNKVSLSNIS